MHLTVLFNSKILQLFFCVKKIFSKCKQEAETFLEQADSTMWPSLREVYKKYSQISEDKFEEYFVTFELSIEEQQQKLKNLKEANFESFKEMLSKEAKQINYKVDRRFDKVFKYETNNLPREWNKESPVNEIFLRARNEASRVIDLFAVLRLSEKDDEITVVGETPSVVPEEQQVMSLSERTRALEHLQTYADNALAQARYAMESSGAKGMMTYLVLGVIAVLGFNEFIWILSNPFLFFFLLIIGGAGFVGYQAGLAPVALPIIFQIKDQIIMNAQNFLNQQLNQHRPAAPNDQNKDKKD